MIPEFPLPDEADLLHSVIPPPIYAEYQPSKLFPPTLRTHLSTGWFKSVDISPIKIIPSVSTRKIGVSSSFSVRFFSSQSSIASVFSSFIANSSFRLLTA